MRWLREPLLHFLLLGGVLFLVFRFAGAKSTGPARETGATEHEIVVSSGLIENLSVSYERNNGRKPTAAEIETAVEEFVREEVLCREARTLGLDRDDPQVRRRLRQRMEFAAEASVPATPPTDAELEKLLRENPARFRDGAASETPALATVRERVLRTWEQEQRAAVIDAAYRKLRANYSVRRETVKLGNATAP